MKDGEARRVLARIGVIRRAADLDLLLFFVRHPRSLLASETLASFLGYDLKEIAEALDLLLDARLITRTQTSAHAARLYVLTTDHTNGGTKEDWLPSLRELASTRDGRLALKEVLTGPPPDEQSTLGPRRVVTLHKPRSATG